MTYQLLKFSWPHRGGKPDTQTNGATFERLERPSPLKKSALRGRHAYHKETSWDGKVSIYEKGTRNFTRGDHTLVAAIDTLN